MTKLETFVLGIASSLFATAVFEFTRRNHHGFSQSSLALIAFSVATKIAPSKMRDDFFDEAGAHILELNEPREQLLTALSFIRAAVAIRFEYHEKSIAEAVSSFSQRKAHALCKRIEKAKANEDLGALQAVSWIMALSFILMIMGELTLWKWAWAMILLLAIGILLALPNVLLRLRKG